jgi:hypothetical protein
MLMFLIAYLFETKELVPIQSCGLIVLSLLTLEIVDCTNMEEFHHSYNV